MMLYLPKTQIIAMNKIKNTEESDEISRSCNAFIFYFII